MKNLKFWLKVIIAVLSALLAAIGGDVVNLSNIF